MAVLTWDDVSEKTYEIGVDRGVLYPYNSSSNAYGTGVAWNGLRSVTESPSGAEETKLYANNAKYGSLYSAEEFSFTIGAYTSPAEFDECDGTLSWGTGLYVTQQPRKMFGFAYRNYIGNDTDGIEHAYNLHLVYGAKATPSEHEHTTINDSPEAEELSWECTTTPVSIPGGKPSAHLIVRSSEADATKLAQLEAILYGSASTNPRLPLPSEVAALFGGSSTIRSVAAVNTRSLDAGISLAVEDPAVQVRGVEPALATEAVTDEGGTEEVTES